MKCFTVFCLFAVVGLTLARPEYTHKYDNVDLDEILANRQLLVSHIKCILEQGKCTPEGKELKSHIKEALEDNCANCAENHKEGVKKVIKHMINKEKEYWQEICDMYDPERKYAAKYEAELRDLTEQ